MEGVTGYVYRNAYAKYYGGIERYFTPFVANKKLGHREKMTSARNTNAGMAVVPQILTNRAEDFLAIAEILREYGYDTVNLNLGCPSGTVAARGRGAGFPCDAGRAGSFSGRDFLKMSAPDLPSRHGSEKRTLQNGAAACHI